MIKKILLTLPFLFLVISGALFYAKHSLAQGYNICGNMSPDTITNYEKQTVDFTISSNYLNNGSEYRIRFYHPWRGDAQQGPFDPHGADDDWGTATVTNNVLVIHYTPGSHGLYSADDNSYFHLRPIVDGHESEDVCRQPIKITDSTTNSAKICNISIEANGQPTTSPKPSDNISFTVSNLPIRKDSGAKRYLAVFNSYDNGKTLTLSSEKSRCVNDNDVSTAQSLGTGLAGSYLIQVREDCWGITGDFDPKKPILCQQDFSSLDSGGSVGAGIACKICPAGSNWQPPNGPCLDSKGVEVQIKYHTCEPNSFCNPAYSELANPICESTNPYTGSDNPNSSTSACLSLNGDGTCANIMSGLGIPIPTDFGKFVTALLGIVLSISGGIAILLIIVSGYRLMVSQGNPEKIQAAKDELTAAIVGLLFIIFSLVILQVIGFDILHLPGFGQ